MVHFFPPLLLKTIKPTEWLRFNNEKNSVTMRYHILAHRKLNLHASLQWWNQWPSFVTLYSDFFYTYFHFYFQSIFNCDSFLAFSLCISGCSNPKCVCVYVLWRREKRDEQKRKQCVDWMNVIWYWFSPFFSFSQWIGRNCVLVNAWMSQISIRSIYPCDI